MTPQSANNIPLYPDRDFIRNRCSFTRVYAMAAGLRRILRRNDPDLPICLAAGGRELVAAALLAGLDQGPELLLPYSFSTRTLEELRQLTGFSAVITDQALDLPAAITRLDVQSATEAPLEELFFDPTRPLLRIFTGGSTGTPRIWTKTCGNLFQEALYLARSFQVSSQDCIVATVPPYHIYGLLFSVLLPLVSGASVPENTPSFPGEIRDTVAKNKGTLLAAVPAHYRALRRCPLSGLRLAVSSAGMLDPADNLSFFQQSGVGVVEVYGSTETGGIATRTRALGEDHFSPFASVDWKIEAERLAVRSPYISPDLPLDPEGFFLTADRVTSCEDKGFQLLGRVDSVVKVGGKRVDLDEIRAILKKIPGVSDCVVIALDEPGGRERTIAALVAGTVSRQELQRALRDQLEPWAMPRRIRVVDQIPTRSSGKYDRNAIEQLLQP